MLNSLVVFAELLRDAGVSVSTPDVIDAGTALAATGVSDRETVRNVLRMCMVRNAEQLGLFDDLFDLHFGPGFEFGSRLDETAEAFDEFDDEDALFAAIRAAVAESSGITPGRFLGLEYHTRRTLRALDVDHALSIAAGVDGIDRAIAEHDRARRYELVRDAVEREIRRVAPASRRDDTRRRDPRELAFLRATPFETVELHRTVSTLGRRLASRLRRRRHKGRVGRLNARATVRRSLASGGIPFEPVFRKPRPHRPDVVVLADVSGSVATFARFTLQLVHALSAQFGQLRTFVFVDEVDEVTTYFRRGNDFTTIVAEVDAHAHSLGAQGHSDYGHVLDEFVARYARTLRPTTTVLILGDARNNYHAVRSGALEQLRKRSRRIYWLNPEPKAHWDTADSVMSVYAPYCDEVFECRTVAQLATAIDRIS